MAKKPARTRNHKAAMATARAARSAQPKPPAWKDNPAGHAAVKLAKYAGFVTKLLTKTKGFPFGTDDLPTTRADAESVPAKLIEISGELTKLDRGGFKLARMKGRGWVVVPGMRVFLKQEGLDLVGQQMKLKGKEEFYISSACEPGVKNIPVRVGNATSSSAFVGLLPKKMLSNTATG